MKVSCVWIISLGLVALGAGAGARALDAPQKVHHARTAEPRLSEAHRSAAHRASATVNHASSAHATAAHPAIHVSTGHVSATHYSATSAHLRRTALHARRHYYEHYSTSSLLPGSVGEGDITAGEDPVVRQAAIDALGDLNGTAVVIDPSNGRILAMVNQKLALSPGAEPCSTIKLTVAMAALSEGLVTRDTMVKLDGFRMDMTQALAHSNNLYFEELGRELGFERVRHYAMEFGLGELAGYNIPGEQLGEYPDQEISAADGGVARMCSFGQGVSVTPLQLGAYVAAIANGGTLYYLQHPTTPEEAASFQPRIKRTLDIARYVPDMLDGMAGAVEYGTARRLRADFQEFPVFGKTGTCSNEGTHLGWFASYSDSPEGSLVTVFFLEGGRDVFGPRAAELTGQFYRNLWDRDYFHTRNQEAQSDSGRTPSATSTGATQ
jgi:penicillin-binding protein 2